MRRIFNVTNERSKNKWCDLFDNNRVSGSISGKHFMWQQLIQLITRHTGLGQLLFSLYNTQSTHSKNIQGITCYHQNYT